MSAAGFAGPIRPVLVGSRRVGVSRLPEGRVASGSVDLTIRRITRTHHGRTLLTLGHAAEYLASSRRYSTGRLDYEANVEAVHLLMGLTGVFLMSFRSRELHCRLQDWLVERVVRVVERASASPLCLITRGCGLSGSPARLG